MLVESRKTEQPIVEPTVICPSCKKEIKLTESLAAPLMEATRRQYEEKLQEMNSAIARREAEVRRQEQVVSQAQKDVEDRIADGVSPRAGQNRSRRDQKSPHACVRRTPGKVQRGRRSARDLQDERQQIG